jgi:hypothetical protein
MPKRRAVTQASDVPLTEEEAPDATSIKRSKVSTTLADKVVHIEHCKS